MGYGYSSLYPRLLRKKQIMEQKDDFLDFLMKMCYIFIIKIFFNKSIWSSKGEDKYENKNKFFGSNHGFDGF